MSRDLNQIDHQRRRFLERCAYSAFGVSVLPAVCQAAAGAASPGDARKNAGNGFGKAKHVIWLMMKGGMSHIDTLDPKPGPNRGPGSPIQNSAGGQFTSYLPETAKVAHKMCVIRSMTADLGVHEPATYFMRTAFRETNTIYHPMLGAWAQELLGRSHPILPSSVSINRGAGLGNGFLPCSTSPVPILDPSVGLPNIQPTGGVAQIQDRLAKLNTLDRAFRDRYPDRNVQAYTEFYDDSMRLMAGKDGEAFDLSKESQAMREAYGKKSFGQGCLLARRLVESGVRFVEVQLNGWDHHSNLSERLEETAAELDVVYPQLLRDLEDRGLLQETLVVLTTEFGRTPAFRGDGRNHYPPAFSVALAGAGVKAGYVYGATDADGAKVTKNPMTVGDLHATIGWSMGIGPDARIVSPSGRPFRVGGEEAKAAQDVFA